MCLSPNGIALRAVFDFSPGGLIVRPGRVIRPISISDSYNTTTSFFFSLSLSYAGLSAEKPTPATMPSIGMLPTDTVNGLPLSTTVRSRPRSDPSLTLNSRSRFVCCLQNGRIRLPPSCPAKNDAKSWKTNLTFARGPLIVVARSVAFNRFPICRRKRSDRERRTAAELPGCKRSARIFSFVNWKSSIMRSIVDRDRPGRA